MASDYRLILVGYFCGKPEFRRKLEFFRHATNQRGCRWLLILEHDRDAARQSPIDGATAFYCPKSLLRAPLGVRRFCHGLRIVWNLARYQTNLFRELISHEWAVFRSRKRCYLAPAFWFHLVCGLSHYDRLRRKIEPRPTDVVILWGDHIASTRYFRQAFERCGAQVWLAELGEIPGSVMISKGLFHQAWPSADRERFRALPITAEDMAHAERGLAAIAQRRISHKTYAATPSIDLNELREHYASVWYVNGTNPFMSGLAPRTAFSTEYSPHYASNGALLEAVVKDAAAFNAAVIYKDHPMVLQSHRYAIVSRHPIAGVTYVDDIDIHEILDVADLMFSLGSKTIYLALARDIPVYLCGPYSIDRHACRWGISEDFIVHHEGIRKLLEPTTPQRTDQQGFHKHCARLMAHYYYYFDDTADPRSTIRNGARFISDLEACLTGHDSPLGRS